MSKAWVVACLVLVVVVSVGGTSQACTTFCLKHQDGLVLGKNLDWMVEDGLVIVNKRGVSKASSADSGAVTWTSKYGSVTFNMYGREFPMGGMNEAGLVVENMWLRDTAYPPVDSRPSFRELQWIQYQLDTAATLSDVLSSDKRVRITPVSVPLHFFVCDRNGDCATVEFIEGKMVYHAGKDLPVPVLTNSTYDSSLEFLKTHTGDETEAEYRAASNSLGRFCIAAEMLEAYDARESADPVDHAFATLDSAGSAITQWSIVYDPGNGRVYFRNRSNREIRHVGIDSFDFTCGTPVKILDILADTAGEVSGSFSDYTHQANYDLILSSYSKTEFLKDTPDEVKRQVAALPDLTRCAK